MGGFVTTRYPLPRCGWRQRYLNPVTAWNRPWGMKIPGGVPNKRSGIVRSYRSSGRIDEQLGDDALSVNQAKTLGSKLAGRNDMYRRAAQTLVSSDRNSFAVGGATYNSIDTGHEFASIQRNSGGISFEVANAQIGRPPFLEYQAIGLLPGALSHGSVLRMLKASDVGALRVSAPPTESFPAAQARAMMTSMVPKVGGVGETLFELLTLNIPSLLTSLRAAARQISRNAKKRRIRQDSPTGMAIARLWGKSTPWLNAVGSDYLEVAFGLLPTIEVFMQLIMLFEDAQDRVYGTSFRRVRTRTLRQDVYETPVSAEVEGSNGSTSFGVFDGNRFVCKNTVTDTLRVTVRATQLGRESLTEAYFSTEGSGNLVRRMGLLSPSLGWELLPFSWMVDWFANFSSGIKRRAFFTDVYPIDYAYATFKRVHTQSVAPEERVAKTPYHSQRIRTSGAFQSTTTTVRVRLDPFGNPWQGASIDAYKAGILTALGLITLR